MKPAPCFVPRVTWRIWSAGGGKAAVKLDGVNAGDAEDRFDPPRDQALDQTDADCGHAALPIRAGRMRGDALRGFDVTSSGWVRDSLASPTAPRRSFPGHDRNLRSSRGKGEGLPTGPSRRHRPARTSQPRAGGRYSPLTPVSALAMIPARRAKRWAMPAATGEGSETASFCQVRDEGWLPKSMVSESGSIRALEFAGPMHQPERNPGAACGLRDRRGGPPPGRPAAGSSSGEVKATPREHQILVHLVAEGSTGRGHGQRFARAWMSSARSTAPVGLWGRVQEQHTRARRDPLRCDSAACIRKPASGRSTAPAHARDGLGDQPLVCGIHRSPISTSSSGFGQGAQDRIKHRSACRAGTYTWSVPIGRPRRAE